MKSRTFEAKKWRWASAVGVSAIALLSLAVAAIGHAADSGKPVETASPIKHVIVIIGENRSFDHVFATYQPKPGQTVANLLSKRIIKADGSPGANFAQAGQFTVSPRASYDISAGRSAKTPFTFLPPPDLNGVPLAANDANPFPPFATIAKAAAAEPDLEPEDLVLLTTGAATGLSFTPETGGIRNPDTRIANVTRLPNGPFQLTGPGMPYDAYTEDTIHRFYQMWQQTDCATDQEHATRANPTGCLSDLWPFVTTTFAGTAENGMGTPMAFLNVAHGDAPVLKRLADQYTLSDNFHQAAMGGTGVNHIYLGTADNIFFSDGKGRAISPSVAFGPALGPLLIGGAFNQAVAAGVDDDLTPFCPICNPFQYAPSIMADDAMRKEHTKDLVDLFGAIASDALPAVSYVKPDEFLDGHPQSSKLDLFEALVDNIIDKVKAKPGLFAQTAIVVTFDEGGGYYDSGFIQPVDFFGDGPRVPTIVVSPFALGGRVVHTYYDHVSIVKFIERNWRLAPLTSRSRDNLPNPRVDEDSYVPTNMPAIGDLFDMFRFDRDGDDRDRGRGADRS